MKSPKEVLEEFLVLLPDVCFVAIDCEFTGIKDNKRNIKDLASYLIAQKESSSEYAMLQIGFCLVLYDENKTEAPWSLYPYNLFTYPQFESTFTSSSETLKWLYSNGFDFNRWISDGIPYRRLVDGSEAGEASPKKAKNNNESFGVQKLIDAIITHRKAIVVHNGLLDILHLYTSFIGALPNDPHLMVNELHRLFGFGVFDTKNIANYLFKDLNHTQLTSRTLGSLYTEFEKTFDFEKNLQLCNTACELKYTEEGSSKLVTTLYHEAGFDATVTAMVFIAELTALSSEEGNSIASILEAIDGNHEKCGEHVRKLINCINIHDKIDVPFFNLENAFPVDEETKKP